MVAIREKTVESLDDEEDYIAGSLSDADEDLVQAREFTFLQADEGDQDNNSRHSDEDEVVIDSASLEDIDNAADKMAAEVITNNKRKKREKSREKKRVKFDAILQRNLPADHTAAGQCAFFAQHLTRYMLEERKMTKLELEEHTLIEHCFIDSTTFEEAHIDGNFGTFVKQLVLDKEQDSSAPGVGQNPKKTPKSKGASAVVLVLCASAIRCVDVIRFLRAGIEGVVPTLQTPVNGKRVPHKHQPHLQQRKTGALRIAKLFAKHLGFEEQAVFLQQQQSRYKGKGAVIDIAVGTANRVQKLLEAGALSLAHTRTIVLDTSFIDAKKRTLFTANESRADLFGLYLGCLSKEIRDNVEQKDKEQSSSTRLLLY